MSAKRLPPRRDRIRAATAMYRSLLDEADAAAGREPTDQELLAAYDEALGIEAWAKWFMPHVLRNQRTGETLGFAKIHRTLFAALLFFLRVLCVLPRGFGKSTICTLVFPLYKICEKRARYLMIGSFTADNAHKLVRMVRKELEENARIREAYGDLKSIDDTWTDEFFITADDVLIESIYFGKAAVRGSRHGAIRPEFVVLDDLETKEEARNPDRVAAVVHWIADEIEKLYFDVQVVVVGTILEDGCAIQQMVEQAELAVGDVLAAGVSSSHRWRLVMAEACDEAFGNLLWPEYFPAEILREMYGETDEKHESFNQEMRHLPRSRAHRDFHTFHYYEPEDLVGHPLRVVSFFDLIPGESVGQTRSTRDTDYYARVFLAESRLSRTLYVLSAFHKRDLTKADMARDALAAYAEMLPLDAGLRLTGEANGFQTWFIDELREIGAEMGLYPPVDGVKSTGNKVDRITSTDHLVNSGRVRFLKNCPHQRVLIDELTFIKNPRVHDDLADAFAGCVTQIRAGAAERPAYESLGRRAPGRGPVERTDGRMPPRDPDTLDRNPSRVEGF